MINTGATQKERTTNTRAHEAEVIDMVNRINPEFKKFEKDSFTADPFKILGLPYSANANDVDKAFKTHIRMLHPDKNIENRAVDVEQLQKCMTVLPWAREKAIEEIHNGRAQQRLKSAATPEPADAEIGSSAREIALTARGTTGVIIVGRRSTEAYGSSDSSTGVGFTVRGRESGGPGHGRGPTHGGHGSSGGGGGPTAPHGHGAADESPDKKSIREITRMNALGDPLQAFVYGCNPVIFQGAREALVELQIARLCGVASRDLGHRINARELQYAVVGRNDNAYLASGDSWKTRDIGLAVAAGRLMQQEMLLRMTVRNDIQQKMRATGAAFGELGARHIDLIYKGVGLKRETLENDATLGLRTYNLKEGNPNSTNLVEKYGSVEFTGIMHEIMNCDHMNMRPANLPRGVVDDEFSEPNQRYFGTGADRIMLTREGIESIKNAVASVSYEAMQKVDHYELKALWGMNGTRESWSDVSIALASDLNTDVAYNNGLVKGRFMLILEALNSLAEGARGWR